MSQHLTNTILGDIFGSDGLTSVETEEEYRSGFEELKVKWDSLESSDTNKDPKFSKYYSQYKMDDIWHHVTPKVSREAGFENKFSTNNVLESANAVLKKWQNFQQKDMSTFIDDIKSLIDRQKNDVRRAFLGIDSPYTVREEYQKDIHTSCFEDKPGKRSFAERPIIQTQ
ncbi:hypothetical protein QZH41_018857, partial [Actinostola sp. cb2023]